MLFTHKNVRTKATLLSILWHFFAADDLQQEVIDQSDSHQTRSGRLYIPHGYGEEKPFKPHISHQNVSYTE